MAAGIFSEIAVIVQCRLSSTRLPQKALKILGGKERLCWTLDTMKKVKAKRHFLACDHDSKDKLEPLAEKCGWEIFSGDRDDVLGRFCDLIKAEYPECDLIVRATGDNPFLFWDAAQASVLDFQENHFEADYFTYSGLPHGSGVELFKAASILKAREITDSAYDKEHVGPALYRHPENFTCVFKEAPKEFYAPDLRTTIDTFADYKRAERLVDFLKAQNAPPPYRSKEILGALKNKSLQKAVLLLPSAKEFRGTGHLRRALSLAIKTAAFVFIPDGSTLKEANALLDEAIQSGLKGWQIIRGSLESLGGGWDLAVLDLFRTSKEDAGRLLKLGPLCSLDDGGKNCGSFDYLLDIIPSMPRKGARKAGLESNLFCPRFLELPKKRRASFPKKIQSALVCVSGETREDLSSAAVGALESLGIKAKAVSSKNPVKNLGEKLFEYDLVVTHYGFTAFEALAANCAVLLLSTSGLHKKLSKRYGFVCLEKKRLKEKIIRPLLENPSLLENKKFKAALEGEGGETFGLAPFVQSLAFSEKFSCPVCGSLQKEGPVVARSAAHTFRLCKKCSLIYLSFSTDSKVQYEADYFGSEYKAQYGRTYLDDFDSIKAQGLRRAKVIQGLLRSKKGSFNGACLLDIGCAYGPFLAAAKDLGFDPFGTDISQSALDYVKNTLGFKAVRSSFAAFDPMKEFSVEKFDAVTMWYVIEHCRDLDSLLRRANALLKKGGAFAFSTPSSSGVSGRFNKKAFFEQSPRDHYTIWNPSSARRVLKMYGFKVVKTVSTGIHPERIKLLKNIPQKSFIFKLLALFCKKLRLGDTFEVYCKKIGEAR